MSIKLASQQGILSTQHPKHLTVVQNMGPAVISTPSLVASATYTIASAGLVGIYTFAATGSLVVASGGLADILVVGGGGGGGQGDASTVAGGAGGAGGYMFLENFFLPAGTYTVTIGGGGAKGNLATPGNPTYIGNLLMCPGGGQGGRNAFGSGGNGASGGGGGANAQPKGSALFLSSGNIRGNNGGAHNEGVSYAGGGGGGAGATGTNAAAGTGGVGGIGLPNNIVNGSTNVYYCGGGGGAGSSTSAAGGLGGGGTGNGLTGADGTANTGGGGGGGFTSAARTGNGGSGYLVIRVRI